MRTWTSRDPEETRAIGRALAAELAPDGIVLLTGALGAGKTALVQGIGAGLGFDPLDIQSPTFTLVREHRGHGRGGGQGAHGAKLVHVDLYRLEPQEVGAAGIEELLAGSGVKAVEWAERLPFDVPGALRIEVARRSSEEIREIVELSAGADRAPTG